MCLPLKNKTWVLGVDQVLVLEKQALYQLPSPGRHTFQITAVMFVWPVPGTWFDYENL